MDKPKYKDIWIWWWTLNTMVRIHDVHLLCSCEVLRFRHHQFQSRKATLNGFWSVHFYLIFHVHKTRKFRFRNFNYSRSHFHYYFSRTSDGVLASETYTKAIGAKEINKCLDYYLSVSIALMAFVSITFATTLSLSCSTLNVHSHYFLHSCLCPHKRISYGSTCNKTDI